MNVERVVAADVLTELTDGLEEGQALDVADRAADFDEHDVGVPRHAADRVLDFIGDVRDHLHRAAEIIAAAFLLNDALVNLARRPVRVLRRDGVRESLVVTEIEVRLGAVVGDVHLAVLIRAHRARIDVDVRVELLHRHGVAVAFEQAAHRRGGEPFAERRHDTAGHEDVFGGSSVHAPLSPDQAGCYDGGAAIRRRTCSRSSGVSTPKASYALSTALMRMPCSSARSCSSDSARSSGV